MSTTQDTHRAGRAAPSKRRGRPGYDRESLLKVAATLFYERGYDGTSMEELSRKLGITKSAIYYHIRGKEQLLTLCVDRALDGLFAVAAEAERIDGRAIDRLEHLVRGSVRVLTEELPFVTVLLRVRGNSKVEREALARRREFDHVVTELVRQAEADGDIRPDVDPAVTARLLFGLVNSLIDWYKPRRPSDSDALAEAVAKIAFDGIRV
jgi:AcrR family transcriptional regulator